MLLACCFREPKPKPGKGGAKTKTRRQGKVPAADSGTEEEEAYVLTKSLISAPMGNNNSKNSKPQKQNEENFEDFDSQISKFSKQQSTASQDSPRLSTKQGSKVSAKQSAKESPRLSKAVSITKVEVLVEAPKSQQSAAPTFNSSTPVSKLPASSAQIFSPNFTNISAIKKKEEKRDTRDVRRMLATPEDLDESYISLSKINHVSLSTNSSKEESVKKTSDDEDRKKDDKDNLTFTKQSKNDDPQSGENQELKQIIEDQRRQAELQERAITALRREYEAQTDRLKREHNARLQEEKNGYHLQILEEKEKHRKEVENAKIIAKNSANETISQLNKQIVSERAKMFSEQQEMKKRMEEEFRMKEDRLQQSLACLEESLTLVEVRERGWQQEREEILQEVQRLKAEASKMVAVLAAEYEAEEELGEDRKRSLTAEVYSLQLVVEMRTQEVRGLRDKLATATRDLDQFAATKSSLRKAEARIEDLEEQVKVKSELERQLSSRSAELEQTVLSSSKVADRMSRDVEQLQWRIRNNYDLPVERMAAVTEVTSTQQLDPEPQLLRSPKLVGKFSNQNVITVNNNSPRKRSLFVVSDEMMEATSPTCDNRGHANTSDLSPCSDFTDDSIEEDKDPLSLEDDQRSITGEVEELDQDADSLDEGVGDISSDGELSPGLRERASLVLNSSCETVVRVKEEEEEEVIFRCDNKKNSSVGLSPVKERIPSRYSFNNTS